MHTPIEPTKTMHKTDVTWQEQIQEAQMGWASVQTVCKKSWSRNDVTLDNFRNLHFPYAVFYLVHFLFIISRLPFNANASARTSCHVRNFKL